VVLERMFYHVLVPATSEKLTAIYVRSSTNMRTTESQLEACRRTAEHLGFDVIHEFIDEAISGSTSTKSRLGTLDLMASLGSFEVLLRRIGVHTIGVKPHKVALVRVDYTDGTARTFRFARGDGVAL